MSHHPLGRHHCSRRYFRQSLRRRRFEHLASLCVLLLAAVLPARADSVVVFNEIMFHPATNEPEMEWLELHNQNAVDMDLGGWRLTGGVDYNFSNGTIIRGGGYLVVAISPATLMGTTG